MGSGGASYSAVAARVLRFKRTDRFLWQLSAGMFGFPGLRLFAFPRFALAEADLFAQADDVAVPSSIRSWDLIVPSSGGRQRGRGANKASTPYASRRLFEHDSRKYWLWLADGVAVGEETPLEVGEFEIS